MNLTVNAALESLSSQCDTLKRYDAIAKCDELSSELQALEKQIKGTMSVVKDLDTCLESLKSNGYTEEWFSIVNEGNRFVTITNLELPKFFGTEQTKQEACESAIFDTVKVWLAKAWEIIKDAIDKMMKLIRVVLQIWGHPKDNSGVFEKLYKIIRNHKQSDHDAIFNIEVTDVESLVKFCEPVYYIIRDLNKWMTVDNVVPNDATGVVVDTAWQLIFDHFISINIQPNQLATNGFTYSREGVQFMDANDFPKKAISLDDAEAVDGLAKACVKFTGKLNLTSNELRKLELTLGAFKRTLGAEIAQEQKDQNPDHDKIEHLKIGIQRTVVLLTFWKQCVLHVNNLNNAYRVTDTAIQSKTDELVKAGYLK